MNEVAELNATEVAAHLLPLLKECADKMRAVAERLATLHERIPASRDSAALVPEAARVLCLGDALDKSVREVARQVSGLIEHAALEYHTRNELKLRVDELEEHIRFSTVLAAELVHVLRDEGLLEEARQLAEKSGRYKAPF